MTENFASASKYVGLGLKLCGLTKCYCIIPSL